MGQKSDQTRRYAFSRTMCQTKVIASNSFDGALGFDGHGNNHDLLLAGRRQK